MPFDWQTISALTLVAAAAFWLIKTAILPSNSCGKCQSCDSRRQDSSRLYKLN